MEYTRFTNLEVTGHLKVAGQEVTPGGGGGGSTTLSGLTDVDISNPTDGQTLVYNATSGKWENGAAGGGSALVVHAEQVGDEVVLDRTYAEIVSAAPLVCISAGDESHTTFTWLIAFGVHDERYVLQFGEAELFYANTEDDYPAFVNPN